MPRSLLLRLASALSTALIVLQGPAALGQDTIKVSKGESIAEAVAQAQPGDKIQVSKGVYREVVTIPEELTGLRLIGKGAVIDPEYAGPGVCVLADDVTVSGFAVRNGMGGILVAAHGAVITRNRVAATDVGPGSMDSSTFFMEGAIDVRGDDALISQNVITGCRGTGIFSFSENAASVMRIEKNTISHCQQGITAAGGSVEIVKNRCSQLESGGIFSSLLVILREGAGDDGEGIGNSPVGPVLVANNKLEDAGDYGIRVSGLDEPNSATVIGNQVLGGHTGIRAEGRAVFIRENRVSLTRGAGIWTQVEFSEVTDNKVQRCGLGLAIDWWPVCGTPPADNVEVRGNDVKKCFNDGILVQTDGVKLIGNRSEKNLGDGIDIGFMPLFSGPEILVDTLVRDNEVKANGHEGIDNSGQDTVIAANKARDNKGVDMAGAGNDGLGSVTLQSSGNDFKTGGLTVSQTLDLGTGL